MISFENISVWGFEHAIRGMRNPMNSWGKSDSFSCKKMLCKYCPLYKGDHKYCLWNNGLSFFYGDSFIVGPNDMALMQKLYKGGSEHRKYLRQIFVSMDIDAPLYWWKEFDTYKVGTVANSCSTMHKIAAKEFTLGDFSTEHLYSDELEFFKEIISRLNGAREMYLEEEEPSRKKCDWWQMIQLLPSSYNQKRTVTMDYENVISMIHQREGHKLDEWHGLVKLFKCLPYIKEIMTENEGVDDGTD